jgi:hypothetical protein
VERKYELSMPASLVPRLERTEKWRGSTSWQRSWQEPYNETLARLCETWRGVESKSCSFELEQTETWRGSTSLSNGNRGR